MRFIKLDTGFTNDECIDLDRVLCFNWYTSTGSTTGEARLSFHFFGRETALDVMFKEKRSAIDTYNVLQKLLDVKPVNERLDELNGKNHAP